MPLPVDLMVQKVIDVVGVSPASFAKAAQNAVAEASKTVRGMRWARVGEMEMELDGSKVKSYRATVRIYFNIER
ncbi:MAG: dodecin family protein [Thermoplasmata archaeon]|nr:dodecin family protein [Thermoplasmata archaeon]